MVFGHALIILPGLIRLRVRYAGTMYVPLFLLHAAVALRVGAGVAEWGAGRASSGALVLLALAGFAVTLAVSSRHSSFSGRSRGERPMRSARAKQAHGAEQNAQTTEVTARIEALLEREAQAPEGLVAGKANKVIANDLGASARTVEIAAPT